MPETPIESGSAVDANTSDQPLIQVVQSHVIRSMDPTEVRYLFFRIDDSRRFRAFLHNLVDPDKLLLDVDLENVDFFKEQPRARRIWPESEAHRPVSGGGRRPQEWSWNVAFTWTGLRALEIDTHTLASFPEDFRDGMAARADRLGDVGAMGPENWEGWLGNRQVHGVAWCNLRSTPEIVDKLISVAKLVGVEILQQEVGHKIFRDDPAAGQYRIEHFGFRDGVSQPFADVQLRPPPPGGGTARPGGTWDPIAPGELLLGQPDEDGIRQRRPDNAVLCNGGTYMVFRKLEQDVAGFRRFLRRHETDANAGQGSRLAAQMVGRWPDGTSLVKSPSGPLGEPKQTINDFRYRDEDPRGERCPLGAHARRTNPRDSNDRDEVRRHRIWRRGIAYGGAFLDYDAPDDGKKRGLLFIAMCARLDQQFEFLQTRWLNGGEFIGQAGLGRCPIVGAHGGDPQDIFVVRNRAAPYSHLPRFVTLRGGDYFFVPSIPALRAMAAGDPFRPSADDKPNPSIDETPSAIDAERLFQAGRQQLLPDGAPPVLRIPNRPMALIGRHDRVRSALRDDTNFTPGDYDRRIKQITEGESMIVSMPKGALERERRLKMLQAAKCSYRGRQPGAIVADTMKRVLARHLPSGRLDVVRDVALLVPAMLAHQYYGVRGPDALSPTAVAWQFRKLDISLVPSDWLATQPPVPSQDIPYVSMAAWTRIAFAHIFINVVDSGELASLAERSTAEFRRHLDKVVRETVNPQTTTFLGCLMSLNPSGFDMTPERFRVVVRLILAELITAGAGTLSEALPNIINYLLDAPGVLASARQAAEDGDDDLLDAIIREVLRFDPVAPILFRVCPNEVVFEGVTIPKGTLVANLLKTAMFDHRVFPDPLSFSTDSAKRKKEDYLHFGVEPHYCWGEHIAVPVLREMVRAIVRLPDLRRAAGPLGYRKDTLDQWQSLVVRIDPVRASHEK